ncbi:MAG: hypothetical protein GF344_02625 [Chitinivibrionales bacterium]|nr:hypothetical protein [Chitinivibrionales bacterium]MBD3355978.1 hypothetical protein [Chitinivibrionales bacterium]
MTKVIACACALLFRGITAAWGETVCERPSGVGWVENRRGLKIVHLSGSFYDMGRQHAELLKYETKDALRAIKSTIRKEKRWVPIPLLMWYIRLSVHKKQEPHIASEFKQEMKGGADASGVCLRRIQELHALTYLTSCAGAAAWGEATRDGSLCFMKSNDTYFTIDHRRKKTIHPIVMVYHPADGAAFITISWPGYVGVGGGVNEHGIVVGNLNINSSRERPGGVPMIFRVKNTLLRARTLDQAVELLTAKPLAGGYSFIVGHGPSRSARVIEMDADSVYVGTWDGPAESNQYEHRGREYSYNPVRGLLVRTNHPLSSEVFANYQSTIDSESGKPCFTGPRYRELKQEYRRQWGGLTADSLLLTVRRVYRDIGKEGTGCHAVSTHQYAVAPEHDRLLLAVSGGDALRENGEYLSSAYNQAVMEFSIDSLLNAPPPFAGGSGQ